VSRVESAKDRAAKKAHPVQSDWRAGEILRFEYMFVVLDSSFRELRRLHHRPQAGSQRDNGHVCGCPTLDPWAKSSGATGNQEPLLPRGIGSVGAEGVSWGRTAVVLGARESRVQGEGR